MEICYIIRVREITQDIRCACLYVMCKDLPIHCILGSGNIMQEIDVLSNIDFEKKKCYF